ncbi:MAG: helix-turn-helix transcriptional regulator [Planctomycetes bacterium]|nr:helix-turn-helix transcriptional regulator [Planctomycetota bacterium]
MAGACAALSARLLAPPPQPAAHDAQSEAIDAILHHIDHCSGRGVSIEHLARIAGYSPFHFTRVFRKRTGRTVHQYVDECRRRAYRDLRAQSFPHRAIAERLGFSCASAFSRWLRGQREHLGT